MCNIGWILLLLPYLTLSYKIYYEYDNSCLSLILEYLFKRQRKTGLPIMKFNDEDIMIDDLYVYVLIIYIY